VIGADFAAGMLAKAQDKVTDDLSRLVSFQQSDLNVPLEKLHQSFLHVQHFSYPNYLLHPSTKPCFALPPFCTHPERSDPLKRLVHLSVSGVLHE
jgi:hypothetical protein